MADILIAVMGATGSGKTTFINQASGASLQVGEGLKSCTSNVDVVGPFQLDDRAVTLIDTPGFDDTTRSDVDILCTIGEYLSATYKDGKRLSGIIYIHRISDVRMGGMSLRNFNMFRQLCGEKTLANVVIVTNMWGNVPKDFGEMRETELATTDMFFKSSLDKGAKMLRNYSNSPESSQKILRHIFDNHPLPLQIQEELVDEGKGIADTAAGVELAKELQEEAASHHKQLEELHQEEHDNIRSREEEHKIQMEAAAKQHEDYLRELEANRLREQFEFEKHQREMEMAAQEEQARVRREAEQAAIEFERQANEIRRANQEALERGRAEAARLEERMRQLRRRSPSPSCCVQ